MSESDMEERLRSAYESSSAFVEPQPRQPQQPSPEQSAAAILRPNQRRNLTLQGALAALIVAGLTVGGLVLLSPGKSAGPARKGVASPTAVSSAPPTKTAPHAIYPLTAGESPVINRSYTFRLLIHCGIKYTNFGGRKWVIGNPVPTVTGPLPDSAGVTADNDTVSGTAELLNENLLVFTVTDSRFRSDGVLRFTPTSENIPLCA